jgi:hypothetical protein
MSLPIAPSKLHPPALPAGHVPRPHLLTKLQARLEKKLVLSRLHGRIEHIQSGATARLAGLDDLNVFILECFSSCATARAILIACERDQKDARD